MADVNLHSEIEIRNLGRVPQSAAVAADQVERALDLLDAPTGTLTTKMALGSLRLALACLGRPERLQSVVN